MWRYLAGGAAALLFTAAGWLLFRSEARPEPVLPSAPRPAAVATAAVAAADVALPAASERTREQKRFDRYDKDRNASVTREEYLAARRKAFAKLDTDRDGRLTFDEWAAKTTQRFATADKDKSGALTATEFATTRPQRKTPARPRCACPQPAADTSDD
jgi:Ca2+-binding EF-hand superfamily protein